ncbi:MAG: hypothetical protein ACK4SM_02090 [Aquificaceae bacterium]
MQLLFLILSFLFSCQEVPKDIPIEKYRRQFIEGVVDIDKGLKDKLPKDKKFLILSVRSPEDPMPIAVLRKENPDFPYRFKITGKDKLSHEKVMEGRVTLTARISTSGIAQTQKGDLIGSLQTSVGTKENKVIINAEVR